MMSAKPPPPIFPRSPSSSTVSESPRQVHTGTFDSNHFPLPVQSNPTDDAPRSYSQPGPILAPIAGPGVSRPPQHANQHHHQNSHTLLSHSQHSPDTSGSQSDHGTRAVSTTKIDQLLSSDRPSYASPTSSNFPTPTARFFDQRGLDFRLNRHSNPEPPSSSRSERQSHPNMIQSPSYTIRRSPDHSISEEPYQPSSRFTPNSVDDVGAARRDHSQNPSAARYRIIVRQQPVAARACGFGERDRRVIDPPPIVQLLVQDPITRITDTNEMRYPFNVVHCTLWSLDGNTDETALIGGDKRLTRRLMGTLVSSPFFGTDENNEEGCFFCFPDLSCRTNGKYRLRFVLMRLEPSDLQPEAYTPIIATCMSDIFQVYTAKEFPGMRPSTQLTKALKKQGCAISVKKGNEKATGPGAGDKDGGSDDEPELSPSQSASRPKRRRKG